MKRKILYCLTPVDEEIPAKRFRERYKKKIEDVIPLENGSVLVFFGNGEVKRADISTIRGDDRLFKPVLSSREEFGRVAVQTGGYGIGWGDNTVITDEELYNASVSVPLSMNDF